MIRLHCFEQAGLAYLTAAALALAERPQRFRFQEGRDSRVDFMLDDQGVGAAHFPVLGYATLGTDLTRLADLRAQPLALAQLLSASRPRFLERGGALLMDELRYGRYH